MPKEPSKSKKKRVAEEHAPRLVETSPCRNPNQDRWVTMPGWIYGHLERGRDIRDAVTVITFLGSDWAMRESPKEYILNTINSVMYKEGHQTDLMTIIGPFGENATKYLMMTQCRQEEQCDFVTRVRISHYINDGGSIAFSLCENYRVEMEWEKRVNYGLVTKVSRRNSRYLYRIDPSTGSVVQEIPVNEISNCGPNSADANDHYLWQKVRDERGLWKMPTRRVILRANRTPPVPRYNDGKLVPGSDLSYPKVRNDSVAKDDGDVDLGWSPSSLFFQRT